MKTCDSGLFPGGFARLLAMYGNHVPDMSEAHLPYSAQERERAKRPKGQIVSADFVPALFIFLGIFLGIIITWDTITSQATDVYAHNDMQRSAIVASDSLIRNAGSPSGWTASNVVVIGLSDGTSNVLSTLSVSRLLDIPYAQSKSLLGIAYDFYIEFNKTSGEAFTVNGTQAVYGVAPPSYANNTVVVRRLFMMNSVPGVMTMRVWS